MIRVELYWEYTFEDIDTAARAAVKTSPLHHDREEQFDTARYAIICHLATCDTRPGVGLLVTIGRTAILQAQRRHNSTHGYTYDPDRGNWQPTPRFAEYWGAVPHSSFHERVEDRVALTQIMPLLPDNEYDTVCALAATENQQQAATMRGITLGTFRNQLSRARTRFFAAWHEGEIPSTVWGLNRSAWCYNPAPRSSWFQRKDGDAA